MPRARNIKPGFFESEDPARVGYPQRLLWIALWTLADREGRLEYRPARIKKYAFGFDPATVDEVCSWVGDLNAAGLIEVYPAGSTQVIQCVNFFKHQKPHYNDPPSEFPPPPSSCEHHEAKIREIASCNEHHAGIMPPSSALHTAKIREIPGKSLMQRASCGHDEAKNEEIGSCNALHKDVFSMNVECVMLNVEGGEGKGAIPPAPPQPQPRQLAISASGPDPDELFQTAAKFACEQLPAGGDVGLTVAAMRVEYQKSASFDGNPAGFCLAYTASVRKWRAAYDTNPDVRAKAAQWWTRDGTYSQTPPAARAPRRFGPVDLKAGLELDDAL